MFCGKKYVCTLEDYNMLFLKIPISEVKLFLLGLSLKCICVCLCDLAKALLAIKIMPNHITDV